VLELRRFEEKSARHEERLLIHRYEAFARKSTKREAGGGKKVIQDPNLNQKKAAEKGSGNRFRLERGNLS